jgi:hypothetical protein
VRRLQSVQGRLVIDYYMSPAERAAPERPMGAIGSPARA